MLPWGSWRLRGRVWSRGRESPVQHLVYNGVYTCSRGGFVVEFWPRGREFPVQYLIYFKHKGAYSCTGAVSGGLVVVLVSAPKVASSAYVYLVYGKIVESKHPPVGAIRKPVPKNPRVASKWDVNQTTLIKLMFA
ncbi:hypothetical protein AVEN_41446-1 [Araneus ventricosus]|uniref:Uncharacterized protein n=1 Tax=Araneus ventricosus TaxID=182803 RepID=A0A4Y2F480_ARAVE|nr:hypothetical protein AVEN_41446-1 [Araneus ventricosus]